MHLLGVFLLRPPRRSPGLAPLGMFTTLYYFSERALASGERTPALTYASGQHHFCPSP
jgi:hypothetical protein